MDLLGSSQKARPLRLVNVRDRLAFAVSDFLDVAPLSEELFDFLVGDLFRSVANENENGAWRFCRIVGVARDRIVVSR